MNECDPQVWVSQMLFRSSILVPSMRNLSSEQLGAFFQDLFRFQSHIDLVIMRF